ncbi:3'(2'),5'-bisphosphate nucleotidase CysQ [Sphingosinicella sp. YJ22]|uniref:3'(2'),5'-bisphosphate nucleotidase CysQ n=1 Tax=Sphingosinicella sp. YJ22 TaxID=1104780 RepID=UPI00140C377C|nr:3'(2'),5'-bisphosphate nucleotidase CysQ [Sphingosinicella sp. YJ22]
MDDHQLAAQLAEDAGRLLLVLRDGGLQGAELGIAGDREANALILDALGKARPEDGVLSEECIDRPDRLHHRRVWIIDPLDGTREYMSGRDDWAVHVALTIDGKPQVGAVAVPALGRLLLTGEAMATGRPRAKPVILVSRTRQPEQAGPLAAHLGAELRPMGSAGAKAAAVVAGEAELYFHAGGQHEWDNCAPVAVALAAGLHASRADGSPIAYNQRDVRVPDLVIGQPELAREAVAFLRSYSAKAG